jgi:hypothetical protein
MPLTDALSAAFREFCEGVQHAISLHRILIYYINSKLICKSSAKVRVNLFPFYKWIIIDVFFCIYSVLF